MAYDNVPFPLSTDRCLGLFEFDTKIVELGNGLERRIANWDDGRLQFDAMPGIRGLADLRTLRTFHVCRRGRARTFPVVDLLDCHQSDDDTAMAFAIGDGTAGPFQLTKTYTDAGNSWIREITKPESGTVKIYVGATLKVEGTDYTINYLTGFVTFLSGHFPAAAAVISWTGRFYVPVRFELDKLPLQDIILNLQADTDGKFVNLKDATGTLPEILMIEDRAA
jgi:uncharacterized protein (TIGR02217 family)